MNFFPHSVFLLCVCLLSGCATRDLNVLIIGSAKPGNPYFVNSEPVPAFQPQPIADHLEGMLQASGLEAVRVQTVERYQMGVTVIDYPVWTSNTLSWFFWPFPEGVEENERYPDLRGELETDWDAVVLIGDPYTLETLPGFYALGVSKLAGEVARGGGETLLLLPWPAETSATSLSHYSEVVYRTAAAENLTVVPAGLIWDKAGSPRGTAHPSDDGAYLAASAVFSSLRAEFPKLLTGQKVDQVADLTHQTAEDLTVVPPVFHEPFQAVSPFTLLADKRRHLIFSNKGTSTERGISRAVMTLLPSMGMTGDFKAFSNTYTTNAPPNDGKGWAREPEDPIAFNLGRFPKWVGEGHKSYVTNPAFWQLGFGFVYQRRTFKKPVADANNHFNANITPFDLRMADMMINHHRFTDGILNNQAPEEGSLTARAIPLRVLWAQISRAYPGKRYQKDRTHLNFGLMKAAAAYLITVYSGRTPVQTVSTDKRFVDEPAYDLFCQRVGYETAWTLSTLQTRVPGFKVTPSGTNPAVDSETFTVEFLYPPEEKVTVRLSVSDKSLAVCQPEELTFTPRNYHQPQTVTVRVQAAATPEADYSVGFQTMSRDDVFNGLHDQWLMRVPKGTIP